MVETVDVDLDFALQSSASVPAKMIGRNYAFDRISDVVRLSSDLSAILPDIAGSGTEEKLTMK